MKHEFKKGNSYARLGALAKHKTYSQIGEKTQIGRVGDRKIIIITKKDKNKNFQKR